MIYIGISFVRVTVSEKPICYIENFYFDFGSFYYEIARNLFLECSVCTYKQKQKLWNIIKVGVEDYTNLCKYFQYSYTKVTNIEVLEK